MKLADLAHMDKKINAHKVLLWKSEDTIWKKDQAQLAE
jgi:hypothetical protein